VGLEVIQQSLFLGLCSLQHSLGRAFASLAVRVLIRILERLPADLSDVAYLPAVVAAGRLERTLGGLVVGLPTPLATTVAMGNLAHTADGVIRATGTCRVLQLTGFGCGSFVSLHHVDSLLERQLLFG